MHIGEALQQIKDAYDDQSLSETDRNALVLAAIEAREAEHRGEAERLLQLAASWEAMAKEYHRRLMLAVSFMPANARDVTTNLPDLSDPRSPEDLFVATHGVYPGAAPLPPHPSEG